MGMASLYVTCLLLIALLIQMFKCSYSLEIQCHKWLHLKPSEVINHTEISSFIYKEN